MTADREVEIKLAATAPLDDSEVIGAVAELRLEIGTVQGLMLRDLYLDDSDLDLARQGLGLRLRTVNGHHHLTWKSAADHTDGLFIRDEIDCHWDQRSPPKRARHLGRQLRARIEPWTHNARLRPIAHIETQRTLCSLRDGSTCADLCIDRVVAKSASTKPRRRFTEIELELVAGDPDTLRRWASHLCARLPVGPATQNKLERAVDRPPASSVPVTGQTPFRDSCHPLLRSGLISLQAAEVACRIDDSPEQVHALRTACRRAIVILDIAQPHLPGSALRHGRRAIKRTAAAFAQVRDLDLLLQALAQSIGRLPSQVRSGGEQLCAYFSAARKRAHTDALRHLESKPRLAALHRYQRSLHHASATAIKTRAHTSTIAKRAVATAADRVTAITANATPNFDSLHPLRIALRRLQHIGEAFAPALTGPRRPSFDEIATLQNALGIVNDLRVSRSVLLDAGVTATLPPAARVAAGAWANARATALTTFLDTLAEQWAAAATLATRTLEATKTRRRP